jgi:DNA-directed RNA polymerase subunit alpha
LNIIPDNGIITFMVNPVFKVKEEKIAENHSEFIIEPLEPGYGHTLGNALRRALLTSIPGAAVTSIKITGVKHKFSTISGVKENVVDLLLNIKGLNFRLLDSSSKGKVSLSVKGSREITGADFDLPENVEIVNKDHYIASINDKKAKLEMDLTIEQGLGYSSAEERRSTTLGLIPTDAVFTPVKRVSYEVSATRVGRQTDLDKLILSVWTNGIISPKDALVEASKILTSYFLQVYEPKSVVSAESASVKSSIVDSISRLTIDELDLPTRIYNSLKNGGIETLGQLLATTKKDLVSMRNMGNKSIMVVEEKLKEKGVSLAA